MQNDRSPRLAVLIDADNASAKIAAALFEEIAKIGEASVRRIYGDFSKAQSKPWADVLTEYAIVPHQQFAYTTGKNASDITLVIDAMDLLHSGRVDGFCLVSSDSDFTRLASRIREHGLGVYGFGEQKTPKSLQQACHRFFHTENLLRSEEISIATPIKDRPPSLKTITPIVKKAIEQVEGEDGWAHLGGVGTQLLKLEPSFDTRSWGFRRLIDLVRQIEGIEVDHGDGKAPRLRQKRSGDASSGKPLPAKKK